MLFFVFIPVFACTNICSSFWARNRNRNRDRKLKQEVGKEEEEQEEEAANGCHFAYHFHWGFFIVLLIVVVVFGSNWMQFSYIWYSLSRSLSFWAALFMAIATLIMQFAQWLANGNWLKLRCNCYDFPFTVHYSLIPNSACWMPQAACMSSIKDSIKFNWKRVRFPNPSTNWASTIKCNCNCNLAVRRQTFHVVGNFAISKILKLSFDNNHLYLAANCLLSLCLIIWKLSLTQSLKINS